MNNIGLKYFFKKYKGCGIRHNLEMLWCELRYAWERAWDGYDGVDVCDFYSRFQERMILILENFKEIHYGLWWVPEEPEHYDYLGHIDKNTDKRCFNEEETDIIIDAMIWHLKMMDDDFVEKQLFGKDVCDDDYTIGCRSMKDYMKINAIVKQNKECFMKLFSMFYFDLWD